MKWFCLAWVAGSIPAAWVWHRYIAPHIWIKE